MKYYVSMFPFKFGARVYFHDDGVIREAEYRSMEVIHNGLGITTNHLFWCGKQTGFKTLKGNHRFVYPTIEDAYQERNRISTQQIDIENFSNKYMSHLNWDGISFSGWIWDGSKPVRRSPREVINGVRLEKDKSSVLLLRNNNVIPLEQFARFYRTADECRADHVPAVATIEDEDNEYFEEQKRKEFYDYVVHHCPGFEDKIDWEYFQSLESMPSNLAEQVKKMSSNQQ
jgi:hypothetical protein